MCAKSTITLSDKPIDFLQEYLVKNSAEDWLQLRESKYGLNDLQYTTFLYAVKRYGYKDIPFDDKIFGHLCTKYLNLNFTEFDHERDEDREKDLAQVFKCSKLFHRGCYNVKNLCLFGLLFGQHVSLAQKKEELWCLVNPEIKPKVTKQELAEVMEVMVYLSIGLRLEIEEHKRLAEQKPDVMEYLRSAPAREPEVLVAQYLVQDFPEVLTEKMFKAYLREEHLSAPGLRALLLKAPLANQKKNSSKTKLEAVKTDDRKGIKTLE